MTRKRLLFQRFVFWLVLLLTAACQNQEPILIFVTPTQQAADPLLATAAPTSAAAVPTDTVTASPTATASTTPGTVAPTATFIGSIIEPGYTLPPTSTPRPTATPSVPPSPTPGPSLTPTPTETPPGPQPTALPDLDRTQIGIQVDPYLTQDDWNEVLRRVTDLQVGWLKVQVAWDLFQPNGLNDISEDFRRMEIYLETAHNQGLQVMLSVAKAPEWARTTREGYGPPDDPRVLAAFISLMLTEFGSSVSAVEIWNEPNLLREWHGKPLTGAAYMELFRPSYDAIRAYSRDMIIITAGLAPTGDNPGSADDRTFMQQMYDAGLGRYTDVVVGIHPYGWGNPPDSRCCNPGQERGWDDDPHFFFMDNIADYRAIMARNGHSAVPMWVTEFGWATWDGLPGDPPEPWMAYNNKWSQANYTMRAFQIAQETDYIGPMILWNLNFSNPTLIQNRDERAAYSLVIPGLPERPLYWMIYDAARPDLQLPRYD